MGIVYKGNMVTGVVVGIVDRGLVGMAIVVKTVVTGHCG